jgi:hypothetical protein
MKAMLPCSLIQRRWLVAVLLMLAGAAGCSSGGHSSNPVDAADGASHADTGGKADASGGDNGGCVPTSADDQPDDNFTDDNCDGIDGNAAAAVFVATSGSDANPGTMQAPMLTINAAIARAVCATKVAVYVSDGTYEGRVTLVSGVSIYGGYSAASGWARSMTYVATILSSSVADGRISAVEGASITAPTTLDRLTIQTAATAVAGASSYALYCNVCTA